MRKDTKGVCTQQILSAEARKVWEKNRLVVRQQDSPRVHYDPGHVVLKVHVHCSQFKRGGKRWMDAMYIDTF